MILFYINLLILVDVITLSDEDEIIGESVLIALTGQRFVGT